MKDGWDLLLPEEERQADDPAPHVWRQREKFRKNMADLIPVPHEVNK
jgi:hypothetical protein